MQGGARAEKQRIRQEVRMISGQLTPEYRREASREITRQVLALPFWKEAGTVMAYWSMPSEPDTRELMETALREGKTLLLPRCLDAGRMAALPVKDLAALKPGALGIPEPELFREMQVEIEPLLRDILDSGLHGAQIDRLHSANITLGAVSDHRTGKRRSGGLRKVLFRPASELKKDYPFLTKYPVLLPAAWCRRVWKYLKEPKKTGAHSPTATLRIGEERVQLLSFYGIIQS